MTYKETIHISKIPGEEIISWQGPNTYKVIIDFELDILGDTVPFLIEVVPEMIKLSEIVPLAYKLSSRISNLIQEKSIKEGITIPCRKGCSACCDYLVPLSIPEAFHLRETVLALPEYTRNKVINSFLDSAKRILRKQANDIESMELDQLSRWYSKLNLTCPFLSDNSCSIYEKRPIACREYLVKDTNYFCNPAHGGESQRIELPASILECLGKLSSELRHTEIEAVMMPLSIFWTQDNLYSDSETWPSVDIIRRFTEIIKESSQINCLASLAI